MQEETRRFAEHMLAQKRALASQEAEQETARQGELSKAWDKRCVPPSHPVEYDLHRKIAKLTCT